MSELKEPGSSLLRRGKLIFPFLSAVIVMLVGSLIFIVPPPIDTQLHETASGKYLTVAVTPDITISLDSNSAIAVTKSEPLRVELLQGNAYFDVENKSTDGHKLEITLGQVRFRDIGTRFSLETIKNGGSLAIMSGQVEIHLDTQVHLIEAGQRVYFDNLQLIEKSTMIDMDIAPWRYR